MKKKFNMEKIRKFVLEKIYECQEKGNIGMLATLRTLASQSDIEFTEEELFFLKDIAELMEISDSEDFIQALFEAEGEEIRTVEFDTLHHNFLFSVSPIMCDLEHVKKTLERTILVTYMTHKLPFLVQLTKDILEWHLSQFEWSDLLSDIMTTFANQEGVEITMHTAYYIKEQMNYWTVHDFPGFKNEFEENMWYHYMRYMTGSYLEEHYEAEIQAFVDGFINEYR